MALKRRPSYGALDSMATTEVWFYFAAASLGFRAALTRFCRHTVRWRTDSSLQTYEGV